MATDAPLPTTSKAFIYSEYGETSVLSEGSVDLPAVRDGDVLIQVEASGVNPVDWKLRTGLITSWPNSFPCVPGWDVAGVIVSAGSAVEGLAVGDNVYAYTRPAFDMLEAHPECAEEKVNDFTGSATRHIVIPAWKVAKAPARFDHKQAAGVPLAGLTAWQGLFDYGKLEAGQTVLILNASGGVGGWAVQFAKAKGLTVIGTCSAKNADYVKSLGADRVVDYNIEGGVAAALAGTNIDVVYDCVGGENSNVAVKVVKDSGIVVSIANFGIAGVAETEGRGITGVAFLVAPSRAQLDEITAIVDGDGDFVKDPTVTVMPVGDIAKAHDASQTHRVVGKIVLDHSEWA